MKVLIVVDMQKDFIDGALGSDEAKAIVPKVAEAIRAAANTQTLILFTQDTHNTDYMNTQEGKNLPVLHCVYGTSGYDINNEILKAYNEVKDSTLKIEDFYDYYKSPFIEKPTFGSLKLMNMLFNLDQKQKISEITLMGVCTGICVLSNTILAKTVLTEVPVNVVAECCACVTPETHKTALEAMKLCQINII